MDNILNSPTFFNVFTLSGIVGLTYLCSKKEIELYSLYIENFSTITNKILIFLALFVGFVFSTLLLGYTGLTLFGYCFLGMCFKIIIKHICTPLINNGAQQSKDIFYLENLRFYLGMISRFIVEVSVLSAIPEALKLLGENEIIKNGLFKFSGSILEPQALVLSALVAFILWCLLVFLINFLEILDYCRTFFRLLNYNKQSFLYSMCMLFTIILSLVGSLSCITLFKADAINSVNIFKTFLDCTIFWKCAFALIVPSMWAINKSYCEYRRKSLSRHKAVH